ncbi:hypothetical protein [Thermotoga sp. KOL6]|uniref:hypothetical protein n=1 Tax=Thermotoga sp. KOL6 TaxID=126741 RepID=UPI000C775BE1|nr:hypothetical protein [Thermotoga sp. KOL6]PLV59890.1 hypothetical protein AS005_00920 [Thermotoga sp. KOL6]
MTHIIHKGLDFFVKPTKVFLNLNMKVGSAKLHPEDLKVLMKKVPVFMMSYYDDKAFMERELEISSADFPNGVIFFSYYEPVPPELSWDIDKKLILQLAKYFHLYDLVSSINSLIDETESFSIHIGTYEEWLEKTMVKVPNENTENLRNLLSKFSLLYTTKILWKMFKGNFEELKKRTHEVAYKFYEISGF